MYAPTYQSDPDLLGAQCIVALVIFGIVWAALALVSARTKRVEPYSQEVQTALSREQVTEVIKGSFPKSWISKNLNWTIQVSKDQIVASGYYLSNGQSCLVLLLTGLVLGYVAIMLAMKQTEEVTVDMAALEERGMLILHAQGLRARKLVDNLIEKLDAAT